MTAAAEPTVMGADDQEQQDEEAPSTDEKVEGEGEQTNPIIRDVTDEGAEEASKKLKFQKTIYVEYHDYDLNEKLTGKFTIKRLTIGEQGQSGVVKAQLNAGMAVDALTELIHMWTATLQFAITDAPDWWNPEELYDPKLLQSVYAHWRAYHDSFRGGVLAERR